MRTLARWSVYGLAAASLLPTLFFAVDWLVYSSGIGSSISLALFLTSAGASAVTTLPASILVRGRPWPSLILAMLYPAAWIVVMSRM